MHLRNLTAAACMAAFASLAAGQDAPHAHDSEKPSAPQAAPGATESEHRMGMGQMHEHMKRMQDEMAAIRAAGSPEERQRLMEEHFKTMESSMAMMRQMMRQKQAMQHRGGGHGKSD